LNKCTKKDLYKEMLLIRRFEEKILEVFSYGKLAGSMFHVCIGEEAISAAVCSAMKPDDYMTSTHRGHGHFIAKGGDLNRMMAELYGKSTGYCKGKGGSMHIADIGLGHLGANGIVGGGFAMAAGAAYASTIRKDGKVTVCFFGDGATNEGLFHEVMNMASIWKLPMVFVCENNQYALSTPYGKAFASATIAQRAAAYNMPGVTVDGMDVTAIQEEAQTAIDRARKGEGPTLLECLTYRFFGHSRGDASVYRTKAEEAIWKARCPVLNCRKELIEERALTEEEDKLLEEEIAGRLQQACDYADSSPYGGVKDL